VDEEAARRQRQREIGRQLSPWSKRRVATWALVVLAFLVAGQHVLAHLGWRPLPMSMAWQDILFGYPMAGALLVLALIVSDPRPKR
jgi:hypothetical protein